MIRGGLRWISFLAPILLVALREELDSILVGLMKSYATAIYSTGFARGKHGAASVKALRKKAAEAEDWIREKIRMSFVTEAEFRAWLWRCSSRRWAECSACPLGDCSAVLGAGAFEPLIAVVGGVAGEPERERDRAWVDEAGVVLRRVCYQLEINLARDAWITHAVACPPPGGRRPKREERQACVGRLEGELEIVQPTVLLLLGKIAMRLLSVPRHADLADLRGLVSRQQWPYFLGEGGRNLKAVFLTHHPRAVLDQESRVEKGRLLGELVEDLRKVKRVLDLLDKRRTC